MLSSSAAFVAILIAGFGALVVWANPQRLVNRLVFTCSLQGALWLFGFYLSRRVGATFEEGQFWYRAVHMVSASFPLHLYMIKEAIAGQRRGWQMVLNVPALIAIAATTFLTIVPATYAFIPASSTPGNLQFGWAQPVYVYGIRLLYGLLIIDVIRTIRTLQSVRRLELQVWLIGGATAAMAILLTEALHAATGNDLYVRIQPFFLLIFYGAITYAITTVRLFDARQLFTLALQRVILVVAVALIALLIERLLLRFVSSNVAAVLLTTGLVLWFASVFSDWLNSRFNLFPQATEARKAAHAIAHHETNAEQLQSSFLQVLRGWVQSEDAVLLVGDRSGMEGGTVSLPADCMILNLMHELKWVTPERLSRERPTPDREVLRGFLNEHRLGALVLEEGTVLNVLVGVGIPATRRPYTYPQVTELAEISSIIQGAFERLHFSMKAQHAEQLATVGMLGAGLAHEIRNPLVTIKTFVHLLPEHHDDPAFRDKFFRLINYEVARIDRLTEQLLDLASPRAYHAEPMPLHPLLRNSLDLVAAKAAERRIRIIVDFDATPGLVMTDAAAVRQVLLNLALNAIHAVESVAGERWIRVATHNRPGTVELEVSDNGPGVASEILPRLFKPFQSTKSSGFGLGLAISNEILSGLGATIAADSPGPGRGATFRVNFPCPPQLS
jgi:signal transduction histidine kinase